MSNHSHSIAYQPWDNSTANGVLAILFAAWIGTANLSLVLLFITNPRLLNSRQNIVLLHNTIADLTAGVFYCPLLAEYYLRGSWAHDCNSFFVWFTFNQPLCFLTVHSILFVLGLRAAPLFCKKIGVRFSRAVSNVLFCVAFLLLWAYLIVICVDLDNVRGSDILVTVAPGVHCKGFMATDRNSVIDVLVYFLPASLCVVLLVIVVVREKTNLEIPRTQLQLDSVTEQTPTLTLRALSAVTLLTCVFPLPSFVTTSIVTSGGACTSQSCLHWIGALSAVSDWIIVSKCGILPVLLLACFGKHAHHFCSSFSSSSSSSSPSSASSSSSSALRGVLHSFRRVSGGGRRSRLVAEDDDGVNDDGCDDDHDNKLDDDDDDAPFSSI